MNPREKARKVFEMQARNTMSMADPIEPIETEMWNVRQEAIQECLDICRQLLGSDHKCSKAIHFLKGKINF